MGINPAQEVFQKRFTHVLEGLPKVTVAAQDLLIVGEGRIIQKLNKTMEENSERL